MKFSTFDGFIGENTYMYIFMYIDNVLLFRIHIWLIQQCNRIYTPLMDTQVSSNKRKYHFNATSALKKMYGLKILQINTSHVLLTLLSFGSRV